MNATIEKFGYPASLAAEFDHWLVLVRPAQVTLGSLVLAARTDATAYGALPAAAFAEQGVVVAAIERVLSDFVRFDKINYLMLMMVDPHVHFHVFPRYAESRAWRGRDFPDHGWPGPPKLTPSIALNGEELNEMSTILGKNLR
jgi:diadenosine tetraphosphate (Ap4A) HIT family hydrolase